MQLQDRIPFHKRDFDDITECLNLRKEFPYEFYTAKYVTPNIELADLRSGHDIGEICPPLNSSLDVQKVKVS